MPAPPLHKTEDWTISGDTLTFLDEPVDGKLVVAHYSYLDAAAVGASNGHTHIREQKSAWSGNTWQLAHTPEIAVTPTVGQMVVFQEDQGGNFMWVAWKVTGAPDTMNIRNMELDATGTFVSWACPAITGFDDVAGEFATGMAAHPTNRKLVYLATAATDGHIRLYRSDDWATVTKVLDLTATGTQQVSRIYVEKTSSYVWLSIGRVGGSTTHNVALDGIWGASDGITFTLRGGVFNRTHGDLWVKEAAPRKMWTWYSQVGANDQGVAYSTDDGVSWNKVSVLGNPFNLGLDRAVVQAFPPITGDMDLRVVLQIRPASGLEIYAFNSINGGLSWIYNGASSVFQAYSTDGGSMFTDPLIINRPSTGDGALAITCLRTTTGGPPWTAGGPTFALPGEQHRQHTIHWTLPWFAVSTNGVNSGLYVSVDSGANYVNNRATAGFDSTVRFHGVAFVQNLSRP